MRGFSSPVFFGVFRKVLEMEERRAAAAATGFFFFPFPPRFDFGALRGSRSAGSHVRSSGFRGPSEGPDIESLEKFDFFLLKYLFVWVVGVKQEAGGLNN